MLGPDLLGLPAGGEHGEGGCGSFRDPALVRAKHRICAAERLASAARWSRLKNTEHKGRAGQLVPTVPTQFKSFKKHRANRHIDSIFYKYRIYVVFFDGFELGGDSGDSGDKPP